MRVLLDENIDRRLKRSFDNDFEVTTVTERGWSGKKNGELLRAAEREYDALVTMGRNMEHQQNLGRVDLGVRTARVEQDEAFDITEPFHITSPTARSSQSPKRTVWTSKPSTTDDCFRKRRLY